MSKLTFVDSGVLIAAARGAHEVARLAMTVLDDPERTFAFSAFVRLEVLPKALRHNRESEARFYETFFQSVSTWASIGEPLAEEFITSERSEKPINKVIALTVRTIHPLNQWISALLRPFAQEVKSRPARAFQSTPLRVRGRFR